LEKDRVRRDATVAELAADVRRHLANEPGLASPPSAAYRLRKFAQRNRVAVTAATVLIAVLALFAGTMAVQARRVALERDRANAEASRANTEATTA
jgi:eukaryotic-like serine/threonine-protein kinase